MSTTSLVNAIAEFKDLETWLKAVDDHTIKRPVYIYHMQTRWANAIACAQPHLVDNSPHIRLMNDLLPRLTPEAYRGLSNEQLLHVAAQTRVQLVLRSEVQSPTTFASDQGLDAYVNALRIDSLSKLQNPSFDTTRLVRLLEELNRSAKNGDWMTVAMQLRAITDHVPSVFSKTNFDEVASQIGGRSLKQSFKQLAGDLRNTADRHLHEQMRAKEILPTTQQVDFRSALDALLIEVERVLSPTKS